MPSQEEVDAQMPWLHDFEQAAEGLAPRVIEEIINETMLAAEKQKEIKEAEQKASKSGMETFFGFESALEGIGEIEGGNMAGKNGMVPAGMAEGPKDGTRGPAAIDVTFPTSNSTNTARLRSQEELQQLFSQLPEDTQSLLTAPSPSWLSPAQRTEYAAFAQMMMRTAGNNKEPLHAYAAYWLEMGPIKLYELRLVGLVCPCGGLSCPLSPLEGLHRQHS